MNYKGVIFLIVLFFGTSTWLAYGQNDDNSKRLAKRKVAKMIRSGYEFKNREGAEKRFENMYIKRNELNDKGEKMSLILEITTKHKDKQVAEDLMKYKVTVELAAKIKSEILQTIETELVQSNRYWELGGHEYFLEVQQAIDEVSLSTALNLVPTEVIYQASRQNNKNYEYAVGHIYGRQRMLDLFIFAAGDYEILDSIYWLHKSEEPQE